MAVRTNRATGLSHINQHRWIHLPCDLLTIADMTRYQLDKLGEHDLFSQLWLLNLAVERRVGREQNRRGMSAAPVAWRPCTAQPLERRLQRVG